MNMRNADLRMAFGFGLLLVIAGLALAIALGKVHQDTSFGLQYLLGSLSSLAGGFAQWAFSKQNSGETQDHVPHE